MYFCQLTTGNETSFGKQLLHLQWGQRTTHLPVGQRTTRLTTNQEVAGSNSARHGDRLFTRMFSVNPTNTTLSTDNRKTLLQPKEEMIRQRGSSLYFGDES